MVRVKKGHLMRILLFSDTYPPQVNGVATSVQTLARGLVRRGHAVLVCTISPKGGASVLDDEAFPVIRLPGAPLLLSPEVRLANPYGGTCLHLVQRFAPDVIHCHTPFGIGWQGAHAAQVCGIPFIGTHHTLFGAYIAAYSHLGRQMNRPLAALARRYVAGFYNHCDLVSYASQFLADDLLAGGMNRPMVMVPNPLNTALFHPLTALVPRPAGEARLIYCGRLAPEKNLPHLVRLVEPVLARFPGAVLEIVGDGPSRVSLEALVQQRGLAARIHFTGWLHGEELAAHVANSTVCVSASVTENQPMALLESLACGVPVVALAAAGIPEIIEQGHNGFLVHPADRSGQFSQRIGEILLDPTLRERMSQAASRSVQHFTSETALHATLGSYQQAIEEAALRSPRATPLLLHLRQNRKRLMHVLPHLSHV